MDLTHFPYDTFLELREIFAHISAAADILRTKMNEIQIVQVVKTFENE